MTKNLHLWVIPLLPLIGAAINGLFGRRFKNAMVSAVALLFTAASFGWAAWAVWTVWPGSGIALPHIETLATWITAGSFSAPFGFYLDQLSMIMVLVVTGVGFLIHIYSVGYMSHEGGYYRFFAYLNLFMFFMLTLVLANNYLLMFVGWEGVGLASYLLIGFYFLKDSAANAGKKAFIVNRIGDFAFLIGMFLIIQHFGSLNYDTVFGKIADGHFAPEAGWGLFTVIGLCLMFGAAGKSAQVPLYVWLPDAMEGPTPVSALIHAATMVTAGIYMIARSHAIFNLAPHALQIVAHYRLSYRDLCRHHGPGADRYQTRARLLHRFTTGLHVPGLRRGCVRRRNFPPDDACVLQGAALPRRGFGDSRHWRRAGHAPHGRPAQENTLVHSG